MFTYFSIDRKVSYIKSINSYTVKVNQKTWLKVERYGRLLAAKLGYINSLSIANYNGAIKKIKNNVVIPVGFYRIYYNDKANFKKCFYYKNDSFIDWKKDKLKEHIVDCSKIHETVQSFLSATDSH